MAQIPRSRLTPGFYRDERSRVVGASLVAGILLLLLGSDAKAQLKGHYVPGFTGLQSGTQPPPAISVFLPLYFYTTNDIRDDNGERLGAQPRINATFIGPGVLWVTNAKILGGNLGGSVVPIAFIKSRIEGASLDVPGSFAFTDIFVQPIQLGWEKTRADFVVGYSLFIPTGKWEQGGDDNAGLGMWSHDLQAGTTLHLDNKHQWTFSALTTYEIHSEKKDSDIKVGDILTIEGGLGKSFDKFEMAGATPVPALVTNVGLVYYGQYKLTSDKASVITPLLAGRKDRVFGAGVEGNVILVKSGLVFGLRVEPEFGARNRTQGWTFLFSAAYQLKSLVKAHEPVAPESRNAVVRQVRRPVEPGT